MMKDDLDLIIHLGDYIYESRGGRKVRAHLPEPTTLEGYRKVHSPLPHALQQLRQPSNIHSNAPSLIKCQHLRNVSFDLDLASPDIGKGLAIGIGSLLVTSQIPDRREVFGIGVVEPKHLDECSRLSADTYLCWNGGMMNKFIILGSVALMLGLLASEAHAIPARPGADLKQFGPNHLVKGAGCKMPGLLCPQGFFKWRRSCIRCAE
jgi:hypothetical protein